jgi:hypothetical protein
VSTGEAEIFLLRIGFGGVAAGAVDFSGHVGCIVTGFVESRGDRLSSEILRRPAGGCDGASREQVPVRSPSFFARARSGQALWAGGFSE